MPICPLNYNLGPARIRSNVHDRNKENLQYIQTCAKLTATTLMSMVDGYKSITGTLFAIQ